MPGTELKVATLDAKTADPLAEILTQVEEGSDPVMVIGLERAVPMGSDDAPILRALNLERAEWPERLPRPVVFWIPEALLGALGRSAPDFLDWRSGTVYLPSVKVLADRQLLAFNTEVWSQGLTDNLARADRISRIEELRSRLRTTAPSQDPAVEDRRGSWVYELGNHLVFLGNLDEARRAYEEALSIAQGLGKKYSIASSEHSLGNLALEEGRLDDASGFYERSYAVLKELKNEAKVAPYFFQMGRVAQARGMWAEAEDWYRKALKSDEGRSDLLAMATDYHQLGIAAQARGAFEEAEDHYERSLALSSQFGERAAIGETMSQRGSLAFEMGRVEEAVTWHIRGFAILRALGSEADVEINVGWLRREREALGELLFKQLVAMVAESPELAREILGITAKAIDEDSPEIAETPADYRAGGRSDGDG